MNKLKILLIILGLSLIPSICNAAVIEDPTVDSANSIVTISGIIEGASKYDDILITVLKPNKKHTDLTAFTKEKINEVYAGFSQFVLKDDTGKYEVKFKFDGPGDYIITVTSSSLSSPETYTYFFATLNDKKNVVDSMVKSADSGALLTALSLKDPDTNSENPSSIPLKVLGVKYETISEISISGFSKVLYALNKESNLTKEDVDLAVSNISDAVMIEKLNEGKITAIKTKDENIGENEIFVDSLEVEKVYSDIYKSKLTEDEVANMPSYLKGKSLTDFKSVKSLFSETVVLSMLNHKQSWSNVLYPAENCNAIIGITQDALNKYAKIQNTGSVAELLNVTFTSLTDYKDKFTAAVDTVYLSENPVVILPPAPVVGGGSFGGGGGGGTTPAIVQPPVSEEPAPSETPKEFTDVKDSHWAYSYINTLTEKKIISGYDDGTFRPDTTVKREEFIKLVAEALELSGTVDTQFSDVPSDAWYTSYVKAAISAGIINGISDTTFGAGMELTRADMALIIARALKFDGETNEEAFNDDSDIPDYAKEAVYMLKSKGILSGNNGNYEPKRSLTRAECAKIITYLVK